MVIPVFQLTSFTAPAYEVIMRSMSFNLMLTENRYFRRFYYRLNRVSQRENQRLNLRVARYVNFKR